LIFSFFFSSTHSFVAQIVSLISFTFSLVFSKVAFAKSFDFLNNFQVFSFKVSLFLKAITAPAPTAKPNINGKGIFYSSSSVIFFF